MKQLQKITKMSAAEVQKLAVAAEMPKSARAGAVRAATRGLKAGVVVTKPMYRCR